MPARPARCQRRGPGPAHQLGEVYRNGYVDDCREAMDAFQHCVALRIARDPRKRRQVAWPSGSVGSGAGQMMAEETERKLEKVTRPGGEPHLWQFKPKYIAGLKKPP